MEIVDEIFTEKELIENPPVLLDIGASDQILGDWKSIAQYSICLAFDADTREMQFVEKETEFYKNLIVSNCIITDTIETKTEFYLTDSPYCSSTLEPDIKHLTNWRFWNLFLTKEKVTLNSKNLKDILNEQKINQIDWFKTDSQGTDLRLFQSLGNDLIKKIIVADFEPGIIDAYIGEDKLYSVLQFMDNLNFWLSDCEIKGSQRINKNIFEKYFKHEERINLKTSPGWGEICFINSFNDSVQLNKRSLLLGCVFSIIKEQYGFALELSELGFNKFQNNIFSKIREYSLNELTIKHEAFINNSFKNRIKNKLIRIVRKI
jgi:hypothetical protein